MKEVLADILVVGGGPAGLTAAIYARRAGLGATVVEKLFYGGQITTTPDIANYPGLPNVEGFELAGILERQAKELGAELMSAEVTGFDFTPGELAVLTKPGRMNCRAMILAMGAQRRKLGIEGEEAFAGRGVSYCATCDGNFFAGKDVAVIGGGNTALEDALYLAGLCDKVYLVHRREEFRGGRALESSVRETSNIELSLNRIPLKIEGGMKVESLTVKDVKTGEEETLPVSAVFIAVGTVAETGLLRGLIPLDSQGRIEAGEDCSTPVPGVFAAGDLRKKPLYQIITAASDGAVAATAAFHFLRGEQL